MTSSPELLFPTWYKIAELQVTSEILTKRKKAISNIVQFEEPEFWLGLVDLYLGYTDTNTSILDRFVLAFRDEDDTFPLNNNGNLVDVLIKITLIFQLDYEEEDFELDDIIAYAVVNGSFLLKQQPEQDIPVFEYAQKYLKTVSYAQRRKQNKILEEKIGELAIQFEVDAAERENEVSLTNEQYQTIFTKITDLTVKSQALAEESNVLWWLFGEYSYIFKKPFKEIGIKGMIACAPVELIDQTHFSTPFVAVAPIFHKAILLAATNKEIPIKEVSFLDTINQLSNEQKNKIMDKWDTTSINIPVSVIPCLTAISKSLDVEEDIDWTKVKSDKLINYKKKVFPQDLASQIYSELLFLKSIL